MVNQSGITTTSYVSTRQILIDPKMAFSMGCVVDQTAGVTVGTKKIVKAGTPVTGDLDARGTAFTPEVTTTGVSNAVGIILHDVDVTAGDANATILLWGFVNVNKMESDIQALITDDVAEALPKITFLKA